MEKTASVYQPTPQPPLFAPKAAATALTSKTRKKQLCEPLETVQLLGSTLILNELLSHLFAVLNSLTPIAGLEYQCTEEESSNQSSVYLGQKLPNTHSVHYDLICQEEPLGKISLFQQTQYSEDLLREIEYVLSLAILPIKHALTYQEALKDSLTDPLTYLGNRKAYEQEIEAQTNTHARYDNPLCLLIIDADKFKQLNDNYGHLIGDNALKHMANVLSESVRGCDRLFRIGGEEFTAVLPNTDEAGAKLLAERAIAALKSAPYQTDGLKIPLSVSIGIASLKEEEDQEGLFQRADQALYLAKDAGRGCSVIAEAI